MRKLFAFIVLALAGAAGATVPSTTSEVSYSCNGTATVHAVPFRFLEASHLVVKAGGSALTITTDYTVQNTGTVSGGTVTLTAGSKCPAGSTLTITRTVPLTQGTSFRSQGSFSPAAHENAFDRLTMAGQQIQRQRDADLVTQDARDDTQELALAQGAVGGSSTFVTATGSTTARTLAEHFATLIWASNYAATGAGFADAAADAAAAGKTLVVTAPVTITTAVGTISAPVRFEDGGKLVLNTGGSVTLSGALSAPLTRIFDTSGGGTLTFSAKVAAVYPQWWGAVGDGVTDDTAAIQAAIQAVDVAGGGTVRIGPRGTYKTSARILSDGQVSIEGIGNPTIAPTHAGVVLQIGNTAASGQGYVTGQRFSGFTIAATASTSGNALLVMACVSCRFDTVAVTVPNTVTAGFVAFRVSGAVYDSEFTNCTAEVLSAPPIGAAGRGFHVGNGRGDVGDANAATNVVAFTNCRGLGFTYNFDTEGTAGVTYENCNSERAGTAAFRELGSLGTQHLNPHIESASGAGFVLDQSTTLADGSGGVLPAQRTQRTAITGGWPWAATIANTSWVTITAAEVASLTISASAAAVRFYGKVQDAGTFTDSGTDTEYVYSKSGIWYSKSTGFAPIASPAFTGTASAPSWTSNKARFQGPAAVATVTTTATTIFQTTDADHKVWLFIEGESGGNQFADLVVYRTNLTPVVVTQTTLAGTPAARTYSNLGAPNYDVQVTVASGTYTVRSATIIALP